MDRDDAIKEAIEEGELRVFHKNVDPRFLATTQEIWRIFESLLRLASPRQKMLLHLRYRQGLPLKEAARELGIDSATASHYLERFGDKVRRFMARCSHN